MAEHDRVESQAESIRRQQSDEGMPGKSTRAEGVARRPSHQAAILLKADGESTTENASGSFAGALSGPAMALPFRGEMESAFGQDFGAVKAHVDEKGGGGLQELGAKAATDGDSIAFQNASPSKELVAHELTHVVQHRNSGGSGVSASPLSPGQRNAAESEADTMAARVVSGDHQGPLAPQITATAAGPLLKKGDKEDQGDWQVSREPPKKETAASFDPIVVSDPDPYVVDELSVPLGASQKIKYSFGNSQKPPAGLKFEWEQKIKGGPEDEFQSINKHKSTAETATFTPRMIGPRTVQTSVWKTQHDGETTKHQGPDFPVRVPVPHVQGVELNSHSKQWGRRPVLNEMVLGDDLLVTIKYDGLDPKFNAATFDLPNASNLVLKDTGKKVGDGLFEVTVTPKAIGDVNGNLFLRALDHHSSNPAAFSVNVADPAGPQGSAGPQPAGSKDVPLTENAVEQVMTAWEAMQTQRETAVAVITKQSEKKDPPPPDPWWYSLIKVGAEIALGAFTGGIGSVVAGYVEKKVLEHVIDSAIMKEGVKEFAKTFVEDGLNKSVEKLREKPEGKEEPIADLFYEAEQKALASRGRVEKNAKKKELRSQIDEKEAKKPGSGVRYAMSVEQVLLEQTEANYFLEEQKRHSFNEYCKILAKAELGTTYKGKDPKNQGLKEKAGTDLGDMVSKGAAELEIHSTHDPGAVMQGTWGGDGPKKVGGVLRLELENTRWNTTKLVSSSLPGLTSQSFIDQIKNTPIKDIELPIVGVFNESGKGAVIGRNEDHQYYASEFHSSLLEAKGLKDNTTAAKHILEEEIGAEPVKPKIVR